MTTTPTFRLNLIDFDTQPWDTDMNNNISAIDGILTRFAAIPNFQGVWKNSTTYTIGQVVIDAVDSSLWTCAVGNTSNASGAMSDDRTGHTDWWTEASESAGDFALAAADSATAAATSATNAAASAAEQARNVGRNKIHNPLFNISQQTGPWTSTGYTVDRWAAGITTDTASFSQATLTDTDRTAIGDEEAVFALKNVFTGSSSAGAFNEIVHRIENVRRLAGKTVTISFWAVAAANTPKLGINILQSFGTGGSPSTSVRALTTGKSVTLSTTWTRYNVSIDIPSISGKTVGTDKNDNTALEFFYSSGATNDDIAGTIGVQSGTISLWGVQLEVGDTLSELEKPDPHDDLARCMRFFQTHESVLIAGTPPAAGGAIFSDFSYPVAMRKAADVTVSSTTFTNASTLAINAQFNTHMRLSIVGTATGTAAFASTTIKCDANL